MDLLNPDVWKQQLAAFMTYPYIMVTGIVLTAGIVWWFRGFQIKVFEARLQYADERAAGANEAKDEVVRKFNDLKAEAGSGALAARVATLEVAIEKLSAANNAVRSAIGVAVGVSTETSITPLVLRVQTETDKERPK
jgi:hypothetical protein